ncbi:hypothetical protein NDU88_003254 [Pleurodeles waltl]|uniref:Uncharacterized protein n=1 Tax=Pleurodeles waltl TaxID=8319 RepID=A0AAV7PHM5_PLEWA|nr:hypothetical protein NDU88_003254 [Pleurodeles waltl]
METRGGGDGSRPRSSGWPTLKKGSEEEDGAAPRDAIRRQRKRPEGRARRREAPNRSLKERRGAAPTRDTKGTRRKRSLRSPTERRRRTQQPATAQEGRGWTRYGL